MSHSAAGHVSARGRVWFEALTGSAIADSGGGATAPASAAADATTAAALGAPGDARRVASAPAMPATVPASSDPASVLMADAALGDDIARFLCIVPNPQARFPRARHGEIGLEEAWTLAARVREVIAADAAAPDAGPAAAVAAAAPSAAASASTSTTTSASAPAPAPAMPAASTAAAASGAKASAIATPQQPRKRPIIAIVDVKSQAYGRREEIAAIYLAAAAAADAYATARLAGHPVIALIVGHALSGAFLAHGYQANRILALDDKGVTVHAMHKEAAARVTRRSVEALDALGARVTPLSYDIHNYAKLGLLHALLRVEQPDAPTPQDIAHVRTALIAAIADARQAPRDLRHRIDAPAIVSPLVGQTHLATPNVREASREVRRKLEQQWDRDGDEG